MSLANMRNPLSAVNSKSEETKKSSGGKLFDLIENPGLSEKTVGKKCP